MQGNVLVYPSHLAVEESNAQRGHGNECSWRPGVSLKVPTKKRQPA